MSRYKKQRNPIKEFKIILTVIGGAYVVFSGFALAIAKVQQLAFSQTMGSNMASDSMLAMSKITVNHLPFLVFLGLVYIVFAWKMSKVYEHRKQIVISLGVIGIIWAIAYTLALAPALEQSHIETQRLLSNLPKEMSFFKNLSEQSQNQEFFMILLYMIAPQILIFIKLNKLPNSANQ